jgi:hypothetical protein
MIEREIIDLFFKKMGDVIKYFDQKFNLKWPNELEEKTIESSLIRNCIMHNQNRVDYRLSDHSNFNLGDEIILTASDVHSYGIDVRIIVRELFDQASSNHFNNENN